MLGQLHFLDLQEAVAVVALLSQQQQAVVVLVAFPAVVRAAVALP
jgi:hypothetical protein